MKIAYVTQYDVRDRTTWSPTQLGMCQAAYYIARQLEALGGELHYAGGVRKMRSLTTKLKWEFYRRVQHKDYYRWAEPSVVANCGKQLDRRLKKADFDVVLGVENSLSLACLKTDKPKVLWTDAPLSALIDFYPYMSNLCRETKGHVYYFERQAIESCAAIVFPSQWAADSAIRTYEIPPEKVRVIPWGANFENMPDRDTVQQAISRRDRQTCELLWVGVDWQRKGGDLALETAKLLQNSGLPTVLNVVGRVPDSVVKLPQIRYFGYLNKQQPDAAKKLAEIFGRSHFFILPTQAETYGLVFAEAQGFGLPCLATKIGGIPTVIEHYQTGWLGDRNVTPQDYARVVRELFEDRETYQKFARSACDRYHQYLSWDVSCKALMHLLEEVCQHHP